MHTYTLYTHESRTHAPHARAHTHTHMHTNIRAHPPHPRACHTSSKHKHARSHARAQDAGYDEAAIKLVDDVMMSRNVPNPRDMRLHDLLGPFGMINFRLLLAAKVVQVRRCARRDAQRAARMRHGVHEGPCVRSQGG